MSTTNSTSSDITMPEVVMPVTEKIIEKFHPKQVILFGSHARRTAHVESDIDLLIVMETAKKNTAQAIDIIRALDYQSNLDLIVRTPETLRERLRLGDSFLQNIVEEGVILYAEPDSRVD